MSAPGIAAIEAAARRLSGHIRTTPLLESPALNRLAGRRVLVKAECLQHTGSFKYRGGKSALTALGERSAPPAGIIAFSSGNHAQGVARAAAEAGMPAVILMPEDAPQTKIAATGRLGAEVVLYDRLSQDRDALGAELAEARGLLLIRPFDDADVIAGQAGVGLEVAEQARAAGVDAADMLVCCGGGGLAAGIALALEARAPGLRVRTVEPEGFDDMARSLAVGEPQGNPPGNSLCDAILTPGPGKLTLPVLARLAGPGLAVSDAEALRAMAAAFDTLRLVVEPGGAVALAAALCRRDTVAGDAVIVVASGGNVDRAIFARALSTDPDPLL